MQSRTATLEDFLSHKPLDIVAIGSPSGVHAEQAIAAAERGLHALVEKPLDISLRPCRQRHRRRGTARRARRRVLSGPVEAGHRACQADDRRRTAGCPGAGLGAREVASSAGVLRRVQLAWHARPRRRRRADEPGDPHRGSAAVALRRGGLSVGDGRDARPCDRSRRHSRGCPHVSKRGDRRHRSGDVDVPRLFAAARADRLGRNPGRRAGLAGRDGSSFRPCSRCVQLRAAAAVSATVGDAAPHARVLEDFIDAIRTGRAAACDAREGRKSVAIVEAIYRAARTGRMEAIGS